jgi:hypothetical protein
LSRSEGSSCSRDLVDELFHLGLERDNCEASFGVFFNNKSSALEVRTRKREGDTGTHGEALGHNSCDFSGRVFISDSLNDEVGGLLFSDLEGEALTNKVGNLLLGDHRFVSALELLGCLRVGQEAFEGEGTSRFRFFALLFVERKSKSRVLFVE